MPSGRPITLRDINILWFRSRDFLLSSLTPKAWSHLGEKGRSAPGKTEKTVWGLEKKSPSRKEMISFFICPCLASWYFDFAKPKCLLFLKHLAEMLAGYGRGSLEMSHCVLNTCSQWPGTPRPLVVPQLALIPCHRSHHFMSCPWSLAWSEGIEEGQKDSYVVLAASLTQGWSLASL